MTETRGRKPKLTPDQLKKLKRDYNATRRLRGQWATLKELWGLSNTGLHRSLIRAGIEFKGKDAS
jgi:hypothetical protein